jgi:hypothetical protein
MKESRDGEIGDRDIAIGPIFFIRITLSMMNK